MIFPLLEYIDTLIDKKTLAYSKADVAGARLALLRPTHMVDYAADVYRSIHGETAELPEEMKVQKESVYKELEDLRAGCAKMVQLCQNTDERVSYLLFVGTSQLVLTRIYIVVQAKMMAAGRWNFGGLAAAGIEPADVETYRQLARYNFDCGDYKASRDMLSDYISLFAEPPASAEEDEDLIAAGVAQTPSNKETGNAAMYYLKSVDSKMLEVLWGRLACEILVEDWKEASVAVEAVKAALESMAASNDLDALQALHQRTWLLHWSLFVYWNDNSAIGLEQLVELFHTERYKQAVTTNAPHLLRYLTAAVLLCKRRVTKKAAAGSSNSEARRLMKQLISVMNDCEYTDPIVEFVDCLCVKFDFDSAQAKLAECESVLASDFFLCHQTALFMEEARVFVFENYCRIHNKIDLKALGQKLAMDEADAERWIVDLIREADLDAKISTDEGCVVMGGSPMSIAEQVMDRTRDLNVRSATLSQNLANLLNDARKEKAKKERESRETAED